jgi:metallo-beta-lactamase class B
MRFPALFCLALASAAPAAAQAADACPPDAKWTDPALPRKIQGNTWYVGTCGLGSILITSEQGHVLIDGGVEAAAPLIEAGIRQLGFRVEDVRYILGSHEHYDHAGGIAKLQQDSHATVLAREPAATALEHGRGGRGDPQFLSARSFPPVANVRRIADGETVALGPIRLTAHATPGHTPGSTTWTWRSCEDGRCLDIVYADSLTAVSDDAFRFSDDAAHPGVLNAFRRSIATIGALPCDILLTPHPGASDLLSRLGPHADAPLIDGSACRRYAAKASEHLDQRIAREKATPAP